MSNDLIPFGACFVYAGRMGRIALSVFWKALVCAVAFFPPFFAHGAKAALVVYEPFDYPADTPLVGKTNGIGFTSAWVPGGFNARLFDLFKVDRGALTYPNLAAKGTNHAAADAPPPGTPGIAGTGRVLATNIASPGATYYLSFLHRPDNDEEFASVVLGTGQGKELSIGKSGTVPEYHISQRGGTGRVLSGVQPVAGKTSFLVVKMEFKEGPDRFTLYVNPTPGKPEPATGAIKDDLDLEFANMLFLYSRAAWSVDEIRLGTTWADVTPVQKNSSPK
jgi:hypothetical protein